MTRSTERGFLARVIDWSVAHRVEVLVATLALS
jgi:hypothetical protein